MGGENFRSSGNATDITRTRPEQASSAARAESKRVAHPSCGSYHGSFNAKPQESEGGLLSYRQRNRRPASRDRTWASRKSPHFEQGRSFRIEHRIRAGRDRRRDE